MLNKKSLFKKNQHHATEVSPIKLEDSNGTVNFATTYSHPTQNNTEVSIRVTNLTNPLSSIDSTMKPTSSK